MVRDGAAGQEAEGQCPEPRQTADIGPYSNDNMVELLHNILLLTELEYTEAESTLVSLLSTFSGQNNQKCRK